MPHERQLVEKLDDQKQGRKVMKAEQEDEVSPFSSDHLDKELSHFLDWTHMHVGFARGMGKFEVLQFQS